MSVLLTMARFKHTMAKQLLIEALTDGLPPARALQAIKGQMLRGEKDAHYRHPYYWAPFVVFGDGMYTW